MQVHEPLALLTAVYGREAAYETVRACALGHLRASSDILPANSIEVRGGGVMRWELAWQIRQRRHSRDGVDAVAFVE